MKIGFCGAHRTGKSTTALAVAKVLGVELLPFSVSETVKRLGHNPNDKLDFYKSMYVQDAIISDYEEQIEANHSFISDRTPIDILAYTTSRIRKEDPENLKSLRYFEYEENCLTVCKQLDLIVFFYPGIPFVDDGKSWGKDSQEELHGLMYKTVLENFHTRYSASSPELCAGIRPSHPAILLIEPQVLDLDVRVNMVVTAVNTLKTFTR